MTATSVAPFFQIHLYICRAWNRSDAPFAELGFQRLEFDASEVEGGWPDTSVSRCSRETYKCSTQLGAVHGPRRIAPPPLSCARSSRMLISTV